LFASLANRWSWVDPLASMAVAARVVRRLDPGDPWQVAARIVAGTAHTTATHVGIVELVLALADAADLAIAPSGEDDRLAHRRLAVLVAALENERHPVSRMLQDKIADELLARPDWWTMGARLRVAASKNAELGERLLALVGSAPSIGARRSLDGPAVMAGNSGARDWSQGDALAVLDRLFAGDAAARLLAVTLLECFGRRWRWGVVFTDPLARARADEDLDVRTRARSLWLDSR
jgi:hypothetical protein